MVFTFSILAKKKQMKIKGLGLSVQKTSWPLLVSSVKIMLQLKHLCYNNSITTYAELEGMHKDNQVVLPATHRTTYKSSNIAESIV